jgi:hypothetical protein
MKWFDVGHSNSTVVYSTVVQLGGGRGDYITIGINFGMVRGYGNLQNQKNYKVV